MFTRKRILAAASATTAAVAFGLSAAAPAQAASQPCDSKPWWGQSYMQACTFSTGLSQAWETPGYYGDCVAIKRLWNNAWTTWTQSCNEAPQAATVVKTPDGNVARWTRAYLTNADGSNFIACFHVTTNSNGSYCDTSGPVWFTVMCNGVPQDALTGGQPCTYSLPPAAFLRP